MVFSYIGPRTVGSICQWSWTEKAHASKVPRRGNMIKLYWNLCLICCILLSFRNTCGCFCWSVHPISTSKLFIHVDSLKSKLLLAFFTVLLLVDSLCPSWWASHSHELFDPFYPLMFNLWIAFLVDRFLGLIYIWWFSLKWLPCGLGS